MASVSWAYPEDQLIALRRQNAAAEAAAPVATGVDINALEFSLPHRGRQSALAAAARLRRRAAGVHRVPARHRPGRDAAALGRSAPTAARELVNYRVQGNHMIVDRLFAAAELRLGGEPQQMVRIVRTDGRPQS